MSSTKNMLNKLDKHGKPAEDYIVGFNNIKELAVIY